MPGTVKFSGRYITTVYGPGGEVKQHLVGQNVVCTNGKEWLARFLASAAVAASTFTARYIAVGTGTGAESAADIAMGTEIARQTATASYVSNQMYQLTCTFATNSAVGAITEYGLFTSSAAGTLISRDSELAINVGASDTLKVIYQLTLS